MWRLYIPALIVIFGISACTHASTAEKSMDAFSCKIHGQFVVVTFHKSKIQGTRNPKYFGVSIGDDFIYLNYPPAHASMTPYNIHTRILKLSIKSQHGMQYKNGVASNVMLFSRPGIYKFLFADNLETEPENTFSLQCSVKINS